MQLQKKEPASPAFILPIDMDRARHLALNELISTAERLRQLQSKQAIVDLYKTWIAFNPTNSALYAACFNYGVALTELPDVPAAINAMRECIRLKPDFLPPYVNLGRLFEASGEPGLAVSAWKEALSKTPEVNGDTVAHKITLLAQMARVLENVQNDTAAEDALKQCLDIDPGNSKAIHHWIALRQRQCKWPIITPSERNSRRSLIAGISPLSLASLCNDPMFQLANAFHFARQSVGIPAIEQLNNVSAKAKLRRSGHLRIGYLSSDLRDHAVGFAMTDVFELHDRASFMVFAYFSGTERSDPTQTRIRKAVNHWIDISLMTDEQAASRIAEDGIDILVDLNGYTKSARTAIISLRPAPIIVNWLGFPGTMGTPYHHYLIADPHIIPPDLEMYYSEKIVRLPCYLPNPRERAVSAQAPSRKDARLPEDAVVYCSMNNSHKLTPRTFQNWMTILTQVPHGVLWLATGPGDVDARLRQHAEQYGISPERLIFAEKKKAHGEHLARYQLADIFLDNFPYGAHTTAADALWMGVPVLTMPGRTFASRVCASLVHAAGIGEMVCATAELYINLAVELGRDQNKLSAIKGKLIQNRRSSLLFNIQHLVRSLEALYQQMSTDLDQGICPIPNLDNLDIYYEIGLECDFEVVETMSNDNYVKFYQEKLRTRNKTYHVRFDERLWRAAEQFLL